jgi:hypothetical protein
MVRPRIAIAGVVVVVAGLGVAPGAWAKNSGPPQPGTTGNGDVGPAAIVCHGYPGATAFNNNGIHGTPDGPGNNCLE